MMCIFSNIFISLSNIANLQSDRVITGSMERDSFLQKLLGFYCAHSRGQCSGETSFASLEVGRRKSITKAQIIGRIPETSKDLYGSVQPVYEFVKVRMLLSNGFVGVSHSNRAQIAEKT